MKREYILTAEEKAQKRQKIEQNRLLREMEKEVVKMKVDDNTSQCVPLTAEELQDIEELMQAYRTSLGIGVDCDPPRDSASFTDIVNIAELSVRRVIAWAKQLSAFRDLPQLEQIQLLKGGSIELLILRSILTYDPDKQQFLDPTDSPETRAMKVDQLKSAESGTELFESHMTFVQSIAVDLGADETTLVLLLTITLFSPDRASDEGRLPVTRQQERYTTLLHHYLDSKMAPVMARRLFPRLLLKLTEIRSLSEAHSQILLSVNTNCIQPLMIEVLDLETR
jgi:nuclear receptor subfamily 1 group I